MCISLTHTETWKTRAHITCQSTTKAQKFRTMTHTMPTESSEHVLICLIKSQLLLPLATLPLCRIDSRHSNWQPEETAEGHSLFSLDAPAWQSNRPGPYWSDEKSRSEVNNCVMTIKMRSQKDFPVFRHWVDHFHFWGGERTLKPKDRGAKCLFVTV